MSCVAVGGGGALGCGGGDASADPEDAAQGMGVQASESANAPFGGGAGTGAARDVAAAQSASQAGRDVPSAEGSAGESRALPSAGASAGNAAGGAAGVASTAGAGGAASAAGAGGAESAPSAGTAGSFVTGQAGGGADSGMASLMDCGDGATMGVDKKNAPGPSGTGRHPTGSVDFKVKGGNRIVRLQTTMEVPAEPNGNSTLFMWPGIEPLEDRSMNFAPIGRGVLQPVLTWGSSCAPGSPRSAGNYWISALYVNISAEDRDYLGCYGGEVMDVEVGDELYIDMRLKEGSTIWNQKVTNLSNDQSVDFDIDLKGQDQNWALFEIEIVSSTLPSSDVIFKNSVMTLATPEPEACQPDSYGPEDYFSAPLASADGTRCCIERIVLREEGVPATTMDP